MSDETTLNESNENATEQPGVDTATTAPAAVEENPAEVSQPDSGSGPPVQAHVPQFANLVGAQDGKSPGSMSRFLDVSVQVSAELGNIKMPIGEILQLSEGSVIELNRALSEPVDLVAQGVRIARGEVVVIDDCFAIRIKEIENENAG